MTVPYTRLQGTPVFEAAAARYALNDMAYHNMGHVATLYRRADEFGMPYDRALDHAILLHDVIYDARGQNEIRSIAFARQHMRDDPDIDRICDLIGSTIAHTPLCEDPRLAMIDLTSFMSDPETRNHDSDMLMAEAMRMRGDAFDRSAWAEGTIGFLTGLRARILEDLPRSHVSDFHRHVWNVTASGIEQSIAYVGETHLDRAAALDR